MGVFKVMGATDVAFVLALTGESQKRIDIDDEAPVYVPPS
jgi:hypothetical protein